MTRMAAGLEQYHATTKGEDDMFRIVVYCEDKRLAPILKELTSLIVGRPEIQPVVNAEVSDGVIKAKTNGKSKEKFLHYAKQHHVKDFSPAEGKKICQAIGMAPGSASYFFKQLVDGGIVRRGGGKTSSARYIVVAK